MSRDVLAYLRFWSRTSRTLPSESRSSPSSVNSSDPVPVTVVAGAAAEVITAGREVPRACLLTGSYRALPRVDSVGERRCITLPFRFSPSEDVTRPPTTVVVVTGLGHTLTPA